MGATAIRALQDVLEKARRDGTEVILSGAPAPSLNLLERAGILDDLDPRNLCRQIDEALHRSREILEKREQTARERKTGAP